LLPIEWIFLQSDDTCELFQPKGFSEVGPLTFQAHREKSGELLLFGQRQSIHSLFDLAERAHGGEIAEKASRRQLEGLGARRLKSGDDRELAQVPETLRKWSAARAKFSARRKSAKACASALKAAQVS
jgi:hypothetical protein